MEKGQGYGFSDDRTFDNGAAFLHFFAGGAQNAMPAAGGMAAAGNGTPFLRMDQVSPQCREEYTSHTHIF